MTSPVRAAFDRFFETFGRLDLDGIAASFTPDGTYHDMPLPTDPTIGPDAIKEKVANITGVNRIEFVFSRIVEDGPDAILAERIEIWHFTSGARAELPVMCTMEFEGGLIKSWREYWDFPTLMNQMPLEWKQALGLA